MVPIPFSSITQFVMIVFLLSVVATATCTTHGSTTAFVHNNNHYWKPTKYLQNGYYNNYNNGHNDIALSSLLPLAKTRQQNGGVVLEYSSSNQENKDDDEHEHEQERIRLNKVFKATHSRRQADSLIESGRVSVNGKPVFEKGGFKVIPFVDTIALDGVVIQGWEAMNGIAVSNEQSAIHTTPKSGRTATHNSKSNNQPTRKGSQSTSAKIITDNNNKHHFEYIKYWKPRGITCTTDRTIPSNIIDDLYHQRGYRPHHRVYPVGRLDKDTSGLVLLTSDGRLPNAALRGQFNQPKVYQVMVHKPLTNADLDALREGVVITTVAQRDSGRQKKPLTARTLPCRVQRIPHTQGCGVTMTLVEGRNRQIRKMMQALDHEVVELHRSQFMGLSLDPLQQAGDWIDLNDREMQLVHAVLQRAATANATVSHHPSV